MCHHVAVAQQVCSRICPQGSHPLTHHDSTSRYHSLQHQVAHGIYGWYSWTSEHHSCLSCSRSTSEPGSLILDFRWAWRLWSQRIEYTCIYLYLRVCVCVVYVYIYIYRHTKIYIYIHIMVFDATTASQVQIIWTSWCDVPGIAPLDQRAGGLERNMQIFPSFPAQKLKSSWWITSWLIEFMIFP